MPDGSGGFTSPDPAQTDDGDDSIFPDDAGMPPTDAQEAPPGADLKVIGQAVDCRNCAHFDVCAYYAAVAPLIEDPQTGHGDPPFAAHDLAAICEFFDMVDPDFESDDG